MKHQPSEQAHAGHAEGSNRLTAHRFPILLRLLLLGGILVAFALRLHNLGAESLWYDETVSVYLARLPLGEMVHHTAGDIHPPGYYALLHLWQRLAGPSLHHGLEFLFAWPSLWFGVMTPVLLAALGRRLFSPAVAVAAVWLAALNPFQLWYSQEVRMYTVGGALGLLCLWATVRIVDGRKPVRWALVYALAAAAGLYQLYYFLFVLVALNTLVALQWLREGSVRSRSRTVIIWLAAQGAALLLWAPWLPIFWRQATNPPVPPWRAAWHSAADALRDISESLAALLVGQTPPGGLLWPWALLVVLVVLAARQATSGRHTQRQAWGQVMLYTFLPWVLLLLLTGTVTPLYHVRYISLFAPLFLLLPALVLIRALRRAPWLGVSLGAALLVLSVWSLLLFWRDPAYRADDHRQAVADLAQAWRPGDLILANAGWIYPALEIYWPHRPATALESAPPATPAYFRLTDPALLHPAQTDRPPVARTGSVDGDPDLGWGRPDSDFFAVSQAETLDALDALAGRYSRIHHYRLYDTVSDPTGVIRAWLAQETTPLAEQSYPGRDFLTVQLFAAAAPTDAPRTADDTPFGSFLTLTGSSHPAQSPAGVHLYAGLHWQRTDQTPPSLRMSLRLYDAAGRLLSQQDETPLPPVADWPTATPIRQVLAVPVPAGAPPGDYSLEVVVYHAEDGQALPLPDIPGVILGQRRQLGMVTIGPAETPPLITDTLARFDYIDLVAAQLDRTEAPASAAPTLLLTWRPVASPYTDNYNVVVTLQDAAGETAQGWTLPAGGMDYPSGLWPTGLPVLDPHELPLAPDLPPGPYTVVVGLERSADGLAVPARRGPLGLVRTPSVAVGVLTVLPPPAAQADRSAPPTSFTIPEPGHIAPGP